MSQSLPIGQETPESDIIYVDLDALLDTRLGTLASLKNEYAVNALENGYLERDRDEFTDVPYEVFKLAYSKRNVETLTLSTFTNVFTFLQSCLKSTFEIAATNPNTKPIQIQVNVHPYDLTEEEKVAISQSVHQRLKGMADVNVVSVPDAFLTPQYCKDTYEMMIRYDYQTWLKIHHDSQAFEKVKMPKVSIIAPAIYQNRPTEQEMTELKEQNLHPFTATEFAMSPFFSLKLVDVNVFCISETVLAAVYTDPDTKKKDEDGIKSEEPQLFGLNGSQNTPTQDSASSDEFELL